MNREIKFRAWNPDDNKMEYPLVLVLAICNDGTLNFKPLIKCTDGNMAYKDYPLMQYTGLKDKNGKEIYEGDILFNSNRTLLTLPEDKRLYLVKWQEGKYSEEKNWLQKKPEFVFEKIVTDGKIYMDLIFGQHQIEVIGNIYENPELLKS